MKKLFFLSINFEFQSTLRLIREFLVGVGFDLSRKLYLLFKGGLAWNITRKELLSYPKNSLGFHLGCFLLQHDFSPQGTCEDHDVFHVLTGYKTDTAQEIAMQYWLYGNGKRSPFVLLAMCSGIVLYPDRYVFFKNAYLKGRLKYPIHHLDYKSLLNNDLNQLHSTFNNS